MKLVNILNNLKERKGLFQSFYIIYALDINFFMCNFMNFFFKGVCQYLVIAAFYLKYFRPCFKIRNEKCVRLSNII